MSELYKTVYIKNNKQQKNNYTNEIEEFGVCGDFAGLMVSKLNSTEFTEINGRSNGTLENTLAINEYTYAEFLDLEKLSYNTVQRIGDDFFISGNFTQDTDKTKIYTKLNIQLIRIYIEKQLVSFLRKQISKNLNDSDLINGINNKLNTIIVGVRKYLKDIAFYAELDQVSRTITINLHEQFNSPISILSFSIRELS